MRILFATPAYPPFPGGGERYAQSLARQLNSRGHHVTVVTSQAKRERDFWQRGDSGRVIEEIVDGVRIIRCPLRPLPGGRAGLLLWRKMMVLLSALPGDQSGILMPMARYVPHLEGFDAILCQVEAGVDLVHGFNISWESALVAGWQFARRKEIPFVVTPFAHFGGGRRDRVALNATMDHQRYIMSNSEAVLALTTVEIARLRERGVTPPRFDVIGGGLDPFPAVKDPDSVTRKYDLARPFTVFVGRANRDKGALDAVAAHRMLQQEGLPQALALIGQTTPEFDRMYRALSHEQKQLIRPLGVLDEAEKHALLEAASVLLLPSRSDSFGIVLLEAWAHGKPVIAARAGGIPAVVDDGRDGILVDYGDTVGLAGAIRKLWTDETLARQMGRRGRAKVAERYTWEIVADRVLANYRQVLNAAGY